MEESTPNDLKRFCERFFLWKMQYLLATIVTLLISGEQLFLIEHIKHFQTEWSTLFIPVSSFAFFNTVTYFCSKFLAKKYGINMFDDLEQEWLKEYQGFDSKAFGEIFSRLIQCRKIAEPYLMLTLIPLTIIHISLAFIIGIVYVIGYFIYRSTYLDTAIADRVPRAFGGGIIISRIMDSKFDHKYNKSIEEKKNIR